MKSYFFIPGNHPKLEEKLISIKADTLIIDLEDSVGEDEVVNVLEKIETIENKGIFIRPRLFKEDVFLEQTLKDLLKFGFRNFIIPKFETIDDLRKVENTLSDLSITDEKIILLIENPKAYHFLKELILQTKLNLVGLAFGSQDYCNETGLKHDLDLLTVPRFNISSMAKAFNLTAIDIACMDVKNDEVFLKELELASDMGFEAKFAIHPRQLNLIKNHKIYSDREVEEAQEVIDEFERLNQPSVFVYKGKAVEPPHIQEYLKILNWKTNYGSE